MTDDELDLLRGFGLGNPDPPPGLADRVAERVLQRVLEAEATTRGSRGRRRNWWGMQAMRHAPAAGVAAVIVVLLSFDGSTTGGTRAQAISAAMPVITAAAESMQAQPSRQEASTSQPRAASESWASSSTRAAIPDQLLMAAGPAALDDRALASIPTDPGLLVEMLHLATAGDTGHDRDFQPFRIASEYVTSDRVPGPVRAAFLRAVSRMQGVDLGGESSDVLGRPGVVIARLDATSGIRQQYLMETSRGQILEHREFTTRGGFGSCAPGTTIALDVYDVDGRAMTEGDVRALNASASWPDVDPACS